ALALLVPAWLIAQWDVSTEHNFGGHRPVCMFLLLASLTYLSARIADEQSAVRRTLMWIGGIALLPCAGIVIAIAFEDSRPYYGHALPIPTAARIVFWIVAVGAPLFLAFLLRGRATWINLLFALWSYALVFAAAHSNRFYSRR